MLQSIWVAMSGMGRHGNSGVALRSARQVCQAQPQPQRDFAALGDDAVDV